MRHWLLVLLLLSPALRAQEAPREWRVLFVGNSLTYVNNLPATLRALAAAQPTPVRITTVSHVAPGGTVAERWDDGVAAKALRDGRWDAVVLQERGGLLACMADPEQRRERECRASERAHAAFADAAKTGGAKVLLLATWGPDATWQDKLDRAIHRLASRTDAQVVPTGSTLRAYAAKHGERETFPDGVHPAFTATLVMAAQLHHAITGAEPRAADVRIDFPLLPANAKIDPKLPLEAQPQLAADGRVLLLKADAVAPLLEAAAE